jgi:CheY-like chemotaxis protein
MNILIAEDDAINVIIYKRMLSNIEHKTTIAHNGEEAVKLSNQMEFDIILMDINMPVMDGIESAHLIRKSLKNSTTFICAVTATTPKSIAEEVSNGTFNRIITKPLSSKILNELMNI